MCSNVILILKIVTTNQKYGSVLQICFTIIFLVDSIWFQVRKALPSITIIAPPHTVKIPNIIDLLSCTASPSPSLYFVQSRVSGGWT